MKKIIVLLFTFVLVLSLSAVFAAAEETSVEDIPTEESTAEGEISEIVKNEKADKEDDDMNVNIKFSTDNTTTALKHMGIGLAGVMMVLALIGVVVFCLNKIFKP